ncbi:hypothetical protein B0H19DRAFT_650550 [Mycena capillaripes]|nr:hypothetical protein B0H19DRAFT_650550 [Mycena capillaripes]
MRKPAASRKPATSQVTSLDDVNLVESPTVSDPPPMDSAISAPTSDTNSVLPPTNLVKSTKGSSKRRVIASSPPAPVKTSISPLLPSLDSMDLSSDSSDSEGGKSPIFDITDTLTASSSFGEDLDLLSLGYSVSDDKLRESFGPDFTPFPPALPEDPLFELYELQHDIPQTSSKPVSVRDSLLPLDDLSRLSENDRIEFYNLVNAGIGPAQDIIEECAGTYKAHMERLYFNRFYPGAQPRSRSQPDAPCYLAARAVIFTRPATIAEKENINPSASRTFIDPQPSNNHYYRQTVVPVSPLRRRNSHYLPLSPRREQPPIPANAPAVKSFVPPIVNNADKITSAIAIRSSRDTILHDHPTPLIWTSPVTSASSQWQAQMTQALTRSNPFAIPTFYSPCGDRIIYQPKSIP